MVQCQEACRREQVVVQPVGAGHTTPGSGPSGSPWSQAGWRVRVIAWGNKGQQLPVGATSHDRETLAQTPAGERGTGGGSGSGAAGRLRRGEGVARDARVVVVVAAAAAAAPWKPSANIARLECARCFGKHCRSATRALPSTRLSPAPRSRTQAREPGNLRARARSAMVQVLCEGGLGFVAMVELLVPPPSAGVGSRRSLVQPSSRMVAAASLACCVVDVSSCGAPVQDATAAPPRTRDSYKLAPRTLALKTRKVRKRGGGGGGRSDGEGGDGGDISDGNCGGDGSWGGGENGRGGWDSWGESWNDESRRWEEGRDALTLLYQAACWLSLSKCVHYVVVKAVGWGREGASASVDEAPFARCSSVFLHKEALGMPLVDKVMC